ncbi:hypothetical protein V6N13_070129 [Hibiscus sabdariffa]|uniref:Uncharacterized protein n=2 Tax=Hibiscus sabdariffa TaxID=183260 RepID=A0ABR1ZQT3_9ROSI
MQPANHHPPIQRSSGSYTNSVPDERVPPVFDVGPDHVGLCSPPDGEGRKWITCGQNSKVLFGPHLKISGVG